MDLTLERTDSTAVGGSDRRLLVQLLGETSRSPLTPIEQKIVSVLEPGAKVDFERLVEIVANELYYEELQSGAWILDIGLVGHSLFVPDVVRALRGANGILWESFE